MEPRYIEVKSYKEWNIDLKVNFKTLFKAVAKAFAGKVILDAPTVVDAAADAWDSVTFTIDHGSGYRAYYLIYSAIRRALVYLVSNQENVLAEAMPAESFQRYNAVSFEALVEQLDAHFKEAEERQFKLYATFFNRPEDLGIVADIQELFTAWLKVIGVSEAAAVHISGRVPAVFVRMLNQVWKERPADFQKLREEFADAFDETAVIERHRYNLWLLEQWQKPIFDESFGLEAVYVPLRGGYAKKKPKTGEGANPSDRGVKELMVLDAETHVKNWLAMENPAFRVMVLKGGPGSGKSSMMKKMVSQLACENRRPVYFIELQRLELESNVQDAIEAYFSEAFSNKIFDSAASGVARKPIFIFDGLDELSHSGTWGLEAAKVFVDGLLRRVQHWAENGWQPMSILTGREPIIEPFEKDFAVEGQVLELLPYVLEQDSRQKYLGQKETLELDQRRMWWVGYLRLKGRSDEMPSFVTASAFRELSAQPLLNFLLAMSYLRGKVDFAQAANANLVYKDLMERVLERPWGKRVHLDWTLDQFLEVMEHVAVSAWHGGEVRITTMQRVKAQCEQSPKVLERIEHLSDKPDSAFLKLMAAFYFRADQASADKTFEFTHKSFGEYLVARRIVALAVRIVEGLRHSEFYSEANARKEWLALCAKEEMTIYVWQFLEREVALRYGGDKQAAAAAQQTLALMLSNLFKKGFELGELSNARNNHDILRATRNAEGSLLLTISAFARVSNEKTLIDWGGTASANVVMSRLFLRGGGLYGQGLAFVTLPLRVDLVGANLFGANLVGANLVGADLREADLGGADLGGADLGGANLGAADLREADLRGAYLGGADLRDAKIGTIRVAGEILDGQKAYDYLISRGAKNVPKPRNNKP